MKTLFIIIFSLASTFVSFSQTRDCKSLRTGSFKIFTKEAGTSYIQRTKDEQIEKSDDQGYEIIFDITWINDCTYELRPKKLIKGDPSIMGNGKNVLTTKIKEISGNSYLAESSSNFFEGAFVFTVEIIK